MTDLHAADARARWEGWVTDACRAVGVDPALVDIDGIHALTKAVAHGFDRPMAPVSSFILGLALAQGGDPDELRAAIESTLPTTSGA